MTIGIIGYGQFGQFIQEILSVRMPEMTVRTYSRRHEPDGDYFFSFEEVCQSDIVIVTVSMRFLEDIFTRVEACAGKDTVIVDVATVKGFTGELLRRNSTHPYIATHPM